jgi:hypothetical protein
VAAWRRYHARRPLQQAVGRLLDAQMPVGRTVAL